MSNSDRRPSEKMMVQMSPCTTQYGCHHTGGVFVKRLLIPLINSLVTS